MEAIAAKRLRREIATATARLRQLAADRRRQRDRDRKRVVPVLARIKPHAVLVASTLGVLEPSRAELPRLFVYWHLKRCVLKRVGSLSAVDDAAIDEAFAATTSGELAAAIGEALDDVDSCVHFTAARWLAEYAVFRWLIDCNLQGATLSSEELFGRFCDAFRRDSMGLRYARLVGGSVESSRLMWCRSFRRRWAIEFRQLPRANPLTNADLAGRVSALVVSNSAACAVAMLDRQRATLLCVRALQSRCGVEFARAAREFAACCAFLTDLPNAVAVCPNTVSDTRS